LADSFLNKGKQASAQASDNPQGKMTSKPFTIQRRMIKFLIGGGRHPNRTCLNLVIEGKLVHTTTADNSERLNWEIFDVSKYAGKTARIEIVDNHSGGWGHVMVDQIVFTDQKTGRSEDIDFEKKKDYGSMALAILNNGGADDVLAKADGKLPEHIIAAGQTSAIKSFDDDEKLIGSVRRKFSLKPGQKTTVTYILSWYFPNHYLRGRYVGKSYGRRFDSALISESSKNPL